MAVCQRCGRCCLLRDSEGNVIKPCKYLVYLNSGKTVCRVFRNRLGKDIGLDQRCGFRKDTVFDFKDCPFNTSKKVIE